MRIENIVKGFGGLKALDDCSFEVEEGRIVGLIGPNGAGKTTLFDVISGVIRSDGGRILFKEKDLTSLKPYEIAQQGIGRTFQITRIFPKMTLLENMTVIATVERAGERVLELLELAELIDLKDEYASNLSFGQEKLLSLIRGRVPPLRPEAPWFGYSLGLWDEEWEREAQLATQSRYLGRKVSPAKSHLLMAGLLEPGAYQIYIL